MGEGSARIFNLISLIFFILTVVVIIGGAAIMLGPGPAPEQPLIIPTVAQLPTLTATPTPSNTPIPTWTPTPLPTETTLPTATIGPTLPPTDIPTLAPTFTSSPSVTPTRIVSDTPTPPVPPTSDAPTEPPSPFPFRLRNAQVAFTENFANTAGCQWQGFGGAVFDLGSQPLNGIVIHVFGAENVDLYSASGTNTLYGQGGWEVQVADAINTNMYYVELQSQGGTIISDTVQVTFPGGCDGNLAIVNFEQTRPF